ncbi:MAG: sporulation transcriptional regulator SpoIIID [Oscillospiraceae bacterium]|nr:sporulation transcriptional regulator SpoIIID [Oscillospiraceae bacterium]
MKGLPEERAVSLAQYIIENNATVRQTAKKFNISKSTVHKDVSDRLKTINEGLFENVKQVLEQNKNERHIRGGLATKTKYERLRQK